MGATQQSRELILQLKKVKAAKDYSCPQIQAMAEAAGYSISLATIKNVFTDGSENQGFNYVNTLKPLAAVLLQTESVTEDDSLEVSSFKKLGAYKDRLIEQLSAQVVAAGAASNREVDAANLQVEYIKGMLAARDAQLRRSERRVVILVLVVMLLLALIIVALVVDRMDPNSGFFWRQISAMVSGGDATAAFGGADAPLALLRALTK